MRLYASEICNIVLNELISYLCVLWKLIILEESGL